MNTLPNASLVVSVALTAACCSRPQRVAVLVPPRAGLTFSGARLWWVLRGRFHRAMRSALVDPGVLAEVRPLRVVARDDPLDGDRVWN